MSPTSEFSYMEPRQGEIKVDDMFHTLRRSTFYTQHRVAETELSTEREGVALEVLRREAAHQSAAFALRHGHMQFREVPRREVDDRYPDDRFGRYFRSQLTILHHEDAAKLEAGLRKIMQRFGSNLRYAK